MSADTDSDVHFVMVDAADRLCIAGFRWVPKDGQVMGPFFTGQAADEHETVTSSAAAKLVGHRLATISQAKSEARAKVSVWAEGKNPWGTEPAEKSAVFELVHDSGDFMGRAGEVAIAAAGGRQRRVPDGVPDGGRPSAARAADVAGRPRRA